jgi:ribonuclease HIII
MEPSGKHEQYKSKGGVAAAQKPQKQTVAPAKSQQQAKPGTAPFKRREHHRHFRPKPRPHSEKNQSTAQAVSHKPKPVGNPPSHKPAEVKVEPKTQPVHKIAIDTGWIGTDESGKGDYFGPLVIGGVHVDSKTKDLLLNLKVRDSKKISDNVIKDLDYRIRSACIYSVVVVGPEKYNLLYQKMKNLNSLLAWGHARVIENLLLRVECKKAISDQFGSEEYIKNALMEMGKKIELVQMPGAEADLGVAAASIVARAEFLRRMEKLSEECGFLLPKGASEQVDSAAQKLVEQLGKDSLNRFTKLHFKNTLRVMKVENPESS